MANQKISELDLASSPLLDTDLIPVVRTETSGPVTMKTTLSDLKSSVSGTGSSKLIYPDGNNAVVATSSLLTMYDTGGSKVFYFSPSALKFKHNQAEVRLVSSGTKTVSNQSRDYTFNFDMTEKGLRFTRLEKTAGVQTGAWQLRMNSEDTYLYSKNHVELTAGCVSTDPDLSLSNLTAITDSSIRINLLSGGDIMNTARTAIYFTSPLFQVKNASEDPVFTITATDTKLQDASQGNILSQHYDASNTDNNTIKISRGDRGNLLEQNATQTLLYDSDGSNVLTATYNSNTANNTLILSRGGVNNALYQDKTNTSFDNSNGDTYLNYNINATNSDHQLSLYVGGNDLLVGYYDNSDNSSNTIAIRRCGYNDLFNQNKNHTNLYNSDGSDLLYSYYDSTNTSNNTFTLSRGGENDILSQSKNNTYLCDSNGNEVVSYVINATTATQQDLYLKSSSTNVLSHHIDTVTPANNTLILSCAGSPVVKRIGNNTLICDNSGRASFISYYNGDDSSVTIQRGKGADSEQEPFLDQNSTTTTICDSMSHEMLKSVWNGFAANNTLALSRFGHEVLTQDSSQTVLNASSGTPIIKHYELSVESIPCCDLDLSVYNSNVVKARVLTQDTSCNWITISRPGNNEILNQDKYTTKLYDSNNAAILTTVAATSTAEATQTLQANSLTLNGCPAATTGNAILIVGTDGKVKTITAANLKTMLGI